MKPSDCSLPPADAPGPDHTLSSTFLKPLKSVISIGFLRRSPVCRRLVHRELTASRRNVTQFDLFAFTARIWPTVTLPLGIMVLAPAQLGAAQRISKIGFESQRQNFTISA